MADGSTFDKNKTYTVVMNSYRANGGGNHLLDGVGLTKEELKKRLVDCSHEDFRRILTNWLQNKGHFKAQRLNTWYFVKQKKSLTKNLSQDEWEKLMTN